MIGKIETIKKPDARRFLEDFLTRLDAETDIIEVDSEEYKVTFSIFEKKEEEE